MHRVTTGGTTSDREWSFRLEDSLNLVKDLEEGLWSP